MAKGKSGRAHHPSFEAERRWFCAEVREVSHGDFDYEDVAGILEDAHMLRPSEGDAVYRRNILRALASPEGSITQTVMELEISLAEVAWEMGVEGEFHAVL